MDKSNIDVASLPEMVQPSVQNLAQLLLDLAGDNLQALAVFEYRAPCQILRRGLKQIFKILGVGSEEHQAVHVEPWGVAAFGQELACSLAGWRVLVVALVAVLRP